VEKADRKLDMIAWQIDAFEKEFCDPENEVISHSVLFDNNRGTLCYAFLKEEMPFFF
jgi:hypothetical protein